MRDFADPDSMPGGWDHPSMFDKRGESESVNPDYLLRCRVVALRGNLAKNALATLDILAPSPTIKANADREEWVRSAESACALAAYYLERLAKDLAPKVTQ